MKKKTEHIPKAYNNLEFLNSPEARTLRILAEFLEPLRRFQKEGVKDTIAVFGSARVKTPYIAKKQLKYILSKLSKTKRISYRLQRQFEEAKTDLEMSQYYQDATKLAYMITKWSKSLDNDMHFVICSGGGPGIMEATNKGAIMAGGRSIGLNISIPLEQKSNSYVSKNLNFEFHYFFMRKFWFVYLAKALDMFPGGLGTLDELMEVLTLLQTKKVTKPLPVVLYGKKYWEQIINFNAMVKYHTISRKDLKLIKFADSPGQAFQYLKKELTKIHLKHNKVNQILELRTK